MKNKNTYPETRIQFEFHRQGLEFLTHVKSLPGTPDMVLEQSKIAIFVNGCFWHRHFNCSKNRCLQKDYWLEQFSRTVKTDYSNYLALMTIGWMPITVWECEANKRPHFIVAKIKELASERNSLGDRLSQAQI